MAKGEVSQADRSIFGMPVSPLHFPLAQSLPIVRSIQVLLQWPLSDILLARRSRGGRE